MAEKDETLNWRASEYIDHQRGVSWYFGLFGGTILLSAAIYIWTKDYFAIGTIIVLGVIVGSVAHWKPRQVEYELSSDGLRVGEKPYPYSQFKTFSIIHQGDLTSLVLTPTRRLIPPISAFFDGEQEDQVVRIIGDHLPMEEKAVDRIDRLSRHLRF